MSYRRRSARATASYSLSIKLLQTTNHLWQRAGTAKATGDEPQWRPTDLSRTELRLIKLVLGEDAYSARQREGYTVDFEKREGLYGRYVAKAWLSWPRREHVHLLPGSAVRLEHADDHPQAIVKTYMESVREHLIAGTFRKKVHDPPAVELRLVWMPALAAAQTKSASSACRYGLHVAFLGFDAISLGLCTHIPWAVNPISLGCCSLSWGLVP